MLKYANFYAVDLGSGERIYRKQGKLQTSSRSRYYCVILVNHVTNKIKLFQIDIFILNYIRMFFISSLLDYICFEFATLYFFLLYLNCEH